MKKKFYLWFYKLSIFNEFQFVLVYNEARGYDIERKEYVEDLKRPSRYLKSSTLIVLKYLMKSRKT